MHSGSREGGGEGAAAAAANLLIRLSQNGAGDDWVTRFADCESYNGPRHSGGVCCVLPSSLLTLLRLKLAPAPLRRELSTPPTPDFTTVNLPVCDKRRARQLPINFCFHSAQFMIF